MEKYIPSIFGQSTKEEMQKVNNMRIDGQFQK